MGVEALEVRLVPAVITVNSLADTNTSDNFLTFVEALDIVNNQNLLAFSPSELAQISFTTALGTNDEIRFAPSLTASAPATITVTAGEYAITHSVKITGPGADKLSFDAGFNSRVLTVSLGNTVEINGLTLKNGFADNGGVILNAGTLNLTGVTIQGGQARLSGGGITNTGTLTLAGNTTFSSCFAATGGAIANNGTLSVNQSTFENNVAVVGGGINNNGTVIVSNSTFASNQAAPSLLSLGNGPGLGGAINNQAGAVTVSNSTFAGNVAANAGAKGGAINNEDRLSVIHCTITGNTVNANGGGAGVFGKSGATTRLYNSILVNNTVGSTTVLDDASGFVGLESFGNLLSQNANPTGLLNGLNYLRGTALFTPSATFPADVLDPQGLRFNGGTTKTIALKPGSPAIDRGNIGGALLDANGNVFPAVLTDQRRGVFLRAFGSPDLGAVEFIPTTLVVDTLADNLDGNFSAGQFSLREAVTLANGIPGDNTIAFAPNLSGTIKLTTGELALTDGVGTTKIQGPGPARLAIDGNNTNRIFNVGGIVTAEISGLTIQNGNAGAQFGGGILAQSPGSLTVSNATIKNNHALFGGGIESSGSLIVSSSTFEGNVADLSGGGVFANGETSVFNSTFLQNKANGVTPLEDLNSGSTNGGGGIAVSGQFAVIIIINCTFNGNQAVGVGGGIAILQPNNSHFNIVHSTLTGNSVVLEPGNASDLANRVNRSKLKGGGLFSQAPTAGSSPVRSGSVTIKNTIVAGNFVATMNNVATDYGGPEFQGEFQFSDGPNPPRGTLLGGNGMVSDHNVFGGNVSQIFAGGLANNGGPTQTFALVNNPANPAFGTGVFDSRVIADQRGFVRSTTAPSIGAFEPNSSTLIVTTTADEDNGVADPKAGAGTSLREAINLANSLTFPTTITFASNVTGKISLTQGQLNLTNPQKITLQGPGASNLALDGNQTTRILSVASNAVANISGLTFRNGSSVSTGGGAIENRGILNLTGIVAEFNVITTSANRGGGAIANLSDGNLTVENSTISSNQANGSGPNGGSGGGISNDGSLVVRGSTFVSNTVEGDGGGAGIANFGFAVITNSTFTQNTALIRGGAVANQGTLFLINSTVAQNFSVTGAGLFTTQFNSAPFAASAVFNSILSGNFSLSHDSHGLRTQQNVGGQALDSHSSNNLIGGDVTTILETIDGTLVPRLADNGGLTQTIALKENSPAIDAGDNSQAVLDLNNTPLTTDQRGIGFTRVFNGTVDIGAFEKVLPTSIIAQAATNQDNVDPGKDLTLTVTVSNTSNVLAQDVTLTTDIPTGTTFTSFKQVSGPTFTTTVPTLGGTGSVSATIASLAANTTATFTLVVNVKLQAAGTNIVVTPTASTTTTSNPGFSVSLSIPVNALPPAPIISAIQTDNTNNLTSVGTPVFFTIEFSKAIQSSSVTAEDFTNSGTAGFLINSVTPLALSDRKFRIRVTPTTPGTLILALSNSASILDTDDQPLAPQTLNVPIITVSGPLVVDSTSDIDDSNFTAGNLSLREAVRLANTNSGDDTIRFAANLGPITLTSGELDLTDTAGSVTIVGPTGGTQIIQRSTAGGTANFRIFHISSDVTANLQFLTIANGNSGDESGGGLRNDGSLVLSNSTVRNNATNTEGAGLYSAFEKHLEIVNSTFSNNISQQRGGGLFNDGLANVASSTFSGNQAKSDGGGIYQQFGSLDLVNTTVTLNVADSDNDGDGDAGGIAVVGVSNLFSSIIAGNRRASANSDIAVGFVNHAENCLVGDGPTAGNVTNGVDGNIVGNNGIGTLPLTSILNTTLANNGGPTQTHALVPLSLARDAGNPNFSGTDQRGSPVNNLTFPGRPDIGAFEYQPGTTPITLPANSTTTLFVAEGKTLVLSEVITGVATASLTKTGTGTLILAGKNTYLGQTTINAGTVLVRNNDALGTGTGSRGTTVATGASVGINTNALNVPLSVSEPLTLNGTGVGNAGALQLNVLPNGSGIRTGTWSGVVTLANDSTIGVDPANTLTISGLITATTGAVTKGLTKVGPGKLILTAANNYTGSTTINAGELTINGSQPKSAIVLNGGTLSGKGTTLGVTGNAVVGSHIAPGDNGPGKLTLKANLFLNFNATFDAQINGTTIGTLLDNIDVTGTVTLNNATLSPTLVTGFASKVGNKYQIITNDGSDKIGGTFNDLAEGAFLTINGAKFQISYKGGTGNDVVLTHVNSNAAFRERSVTSTIGENGVVTLQGTIVEVDPKDRFKLTINWGDGRQEVRQFPAGSNGQLVTLTHQYRNGRATPYDISLDWRDQHGGGNRDHLSVLVNNVAPTATVSGPDTFTAGQRQRFTFHATDPSPGDQASLMQWTIDWGDGTTETLSRASQFTRSHRYTQPGDYLIRATTTDRDGLVSAITTHRVHVEPIASLANLSLRTIGDLRMTV